jgi:hypothetical protein
MLVGPTRSTIRFSPALQREFLERADKAFESSEQTSQEEGRIAELERMVGQLTMQLEIAKKASKLLNGDKSSAVGEAISPELSCGRCLSCV